MIPPSISTLSPSMTGGERSCLSQRPQPRRWDPGGALQMANPRRSSPPGAANAWPTEERPRCAPVAAAPQPAGAGVWAGRRLRSRRRAEPPPRPPAAGWLGRLRCVRSGRRVPAPGQPCRGQGELPSPRVNVHVPTRGRTCGGSASRRRQRLSSLPRLRPRARLGRSGGKRGTPQGATERRLGRQPRGHSPAPRRPAPPPSPAVTVTSE